MIGRMLVVDCKRAFRDTFFLAIVLTLVIQFQGMGEYLSWFIQGQYHSWVLYDLHLSFNTGTFQLFMPTVATLVYSASYLSDQQSGFLRYELLRTGCPNGYLLSKILTTYFSTLCAVFLGILLFAAILRIRMPLESAEYPGEMASFACGTLSLEGKNFLYLLCSAFFKSAAAASWALYGLMLSTVVHSQLAIYTLPTLSCYALNILMSQLGLSTFSCMENGIETCGVPVLDFVRIYGVLLIFSLAWGVFFFLKARRQVRT